MLQKKSLGEMKTFYHKTQISFEETATKLPCANNLMILNSLSALSGPQVSLNFGSHCSMYCGPGLANMLATFDGFRAGGGANYVLALSALAPAESSIRMRERENANGNEAESTRARAWARQWNG